MLKTSTQPKCETRAPLMTQTLSLPVLASGIQKTVKAASKQKTSGSVVTASSAAPRRSGVKGRLLWVGDAGAATGFATVTHSVLEQLHPAWDVIVSGVNYDGAPHSFPYAIMPACHGGDMWGMDRFAHV